MKSSLLLLAALALAAPQAVIAQSATLVIRGRDSFEAIPMDSMDLCEEAGAKYMASKRMSWVGPSTMKGFECFQTGK